MFDDRHLKRPLLDVLDLKTLVDVEISYSGATQADQIGSTLQSLTDISCQSADISTLAANDADGEVWGVRSYFLADLWCWSLNLCGNLFFIRVLLFPERNKSQVLDALLPATIFLNIYAVADGRKELLGLRRDDSLLWQMQVEYFNLVDDQFLSLELYFLTLTDIVESASALYLTSRIDRRDLPDTSLELLKRRHHCLTGNVAGRESRIDRMLSIKRWCRAT